MSADLWPRDLADEEGWAEGIQCYREAMAEILDPEAFMGRVVDELLSLVPSADGACVGLAGESGLLTVVRVAGALSGLAGATISPTDSLSGLAMRTATVQRCDDALLDPRADRVAFEQIEMSSMVSVPLLRGGEAFGVVNVLARRAGAFGDADVAVCTAISEVLAGIISVSAEIDALVAGLERQGSTVSAPVAGGDAVARFVTNLLSPSAGRAVETRARIHQAIAEHRFAMAVQPIVDLSTMRTVAVEALARFVGPPDQPPDHWFAEAESVGLGVDLELAAARRALELLADLPDGVVLAVNLGPDALADRRFAAMLGEVDARRVVIELTEHVAVRDYEVLRGCLRSLRRMGARLSVDDTGAGYASLSHIVKLAPEFIKLDRGLVAGIDEDSVRRALAVALVSFAHEAGTRVVGEGIETLEELVALKALGVDYGQGYHLARPAPLPVVLAAQAQSVA